MERHYVIVNDHIMIFKTEDEAKKFANSLVEDDTVYYIEYGVERYDNWSGMLPTAIIKNVGDEHEHKLAC